MRLDSFRITNFRSIVDTGWCKFSHDGVTVLVGQNESGKTSVLEALAKTFAKVEISSEDLRTGAPLPEIWIRVEVTYPELEARLLKYTENIRSLIQNHLKDQHGIVGLRFFWNQDGENKSAYLGTYDMEASDLANQLDSFVSTEAIQSTSDESAPKSTDAAESGINKPLDSGTNVDKAESIGSDSTPTDVTPTPATPELSSSDFGEMVFDLGPKATLFQQQSGLLPDTIKITNEYKLQGEGAVAARNFLTVAKIDLQELVTSDIRTQRSLLKKANESISRDFGKFWTQAVGKIKRLDLECELGIHAADKGPDAGKPYLIFWIADGMNKLYPKQRSQGVRWFISFFLQLRASEMGAIRRIFLLDEPGANLHTKAQADVLRLIDKISKDIQIVYSTHSASMIEYEKLYRVLAVQREGDEDDSPSVIIHAHKLGTASRDTLSPVLSAMGIDLSSQTVIRKNNNVILEEMSCFYYLTAFWRLAAEQREVHLIAATGIDNVEPLANMFRGWGLNFIVAVDDDNHGRKVYNTLKRYMYGDDEELAKQNMLKFPNCPGIEDAFSIADYKQLVLERPELEVAPSNSEFMKRSGISKHVTAYQFMTRVTEGKVAMDQFDQESRNKINLIVSEISKRLH
jgi:hypothetical protein